MRDRHVRRIRTSANHVNARSIRRARHHRQDENLPGRRPALCPASFAPWTRFAEASSSPVLVASLAIAVSEQEQRGWRRLAEDIFKIAVSEQEQRDTGG